MADDDKPIDCRMAGHDYPYRPSVFSTRKPQPGTDVCKRCGITRIINEDGSKKFIRPKADDV